MRRLLGLVVTLAISSTSTAADNDANYATLGTGTQSCGKYVAARAESYGDNAYRSWLAGYLSRYNQTATDTYNILGGSDMDGAMLWLENYCRANPLEDFTAAAIQLTKALRPTRQKKASA